MRLGSALDSTTRADRCSPLASSTPFARPRETVTRATSASVRISAPCSRAASAIAAVTRPIPPATKPQGTAPEGSAACSCSRATAVPGADGPASVFEIASQPSAAFTSGETNRSSR